MAKIHVPTEVLDEIFHHLVDDKTASWKDAEFVPRSQIIPLLRVCKSWYPVAEKKLYESVSVGDKLHRQSIAVRNLERSLTREAYTPKPQYEGRERSEERVIEDFLCVLEANQHKAGLVKELKLGMGHRASVMGMDSPADQIRAEMHIKILQLCPNVRHVAIREFHLPSLKKLFYVLKEKSLISFAIRLVANLHTSAKRGDSVPLLYLMHGWPDLQSFEVEDKILDPQTADLVTFEPTLNRCPNLQTLDITSAGFDSSDLISLRTMCPRVSKLKICFKGTQVSSTIELDALCKCLLAWSPTLEIVYLEFGSAPCIHHPFSDALSTLINLKELCLSCIEIDVRSLSDLPYLQHLDLKATFIDNANQHALLELLRDASKFPSLTFLGILDMFYQREVENEIVSICDRRGIELPGGIEIHEFISYVLAVNQHCKLEQL